MSCFKAFASPQNHFLYFARIARNRPTYRGFTCFSEDRAVWTEYEAFIAVVAAGELIGFSAGVVDIKKSLHFTIKNQRNTQFSEIEKQKRPTAKVDLLSFVSVNHFQTISTN